MSELAQRLEIEQSPRPWRMPRLLPLSHVLAVEAREDRELTVKQQYRMILRATFRASCWATPGSSGPDSVDAGMRDMRQSIVNQVFREFRRPLDNLRRAALDEDNERIREIVTEIEERMFKV